MPTNAMRLKEEKSGHEKGNLKGNKRAGKITEKERPAERTAERLLGRSYRKGFYGGWSVFLFFAFCAGCFVLQYGVFGSSIDWISQHSTLADYFRKRFYATGNLFPDFAWNLGGGQNIYHFAYYGLLSPTMLLSYLFPFIPMDLW